MLKWTFLKFKGSIAILCQIWKLKMNISNSETFSNIQMEKVEHVHVQMSFWFPRFKHKDTHPGSNLKMNKSWKPCLLCMDRKIYDIAFIPVQKRKWTKMKLRLCCHEMKTVGEWNVLAYTVINAIVWFIVLCAAYVLFRTLLFKTLILMIIFIFYKGLSKSNDLKVRIYERMNERTHVRSIRRKFGKEGFQIWLFPFFKTLFNTKTFIFYKGSSDGEK